MYGSKSCRSIHDGGRQASHDYFMCQDRSIGPTCLCLLIVAPQYPTYARAHKEMRVMVFGSHPRATP
ncbi:MAG TPA: hypothetical protein DHV03_01175 [Alphaproteobacteria bacterium]|nr:hypothetical protein [Alphaproteobacteria bacterium]